MKSNTNDKNPAKQTFRSANANQTKRLIQAMAVDFASLALTLNATAADVHLNATDASGSTSFNTAGHWDNGAAPTAGNNYFTAGFTLRTPASGSVSFAGDSLTLSPV